MSNNFDASLFVKETPDLEQGATPEKETDGKKGGKHLRWTRITKKADVKEAKSVAAPSPDCTEELKAKNTSSDEKTILNGISGSAAPGEVLALMGPSGSGKTSILDVLSGRSTYDAGAITVDGEVVTDNIMKKMKKKVAYVKQNDLFFGHLTVRDQLTYTAFLRLPSSWAKARKVAEVDCIIKQLRLKKCADTPIYMASGGEQKRVNIGSELLTNPSIILLDEPTSGLDSTNAVALMQVLDSLSRDEGKTIVTSIHQPSSAVFFGFNKLMLLADGIVVYFGTPEGSLGHVKSLGLECPAGYNAADHHMDLLVVDSAIDEDTSDEEDEFKEDEKGRVDNYNTSSGLVHRRKRAIARQSVGGTTTKQKLIDSWDQEASAKKIEEEVEQELKGVGCRGKRSQRESIIMTEKSFQSTWWTQYSVLFQRSLKNSRCAVFTPINLTKAGIIGLMFGLMWFQMPYTESRVFDRTSYYLISTTLWVLDAMFTAYMTFPLERSILFRERSSGAYRLSAYFMAKNTSETPMRLALPTIIIVISYWLSGVNNSFGIFISSTLSSLLGTLAGESIGLFLGATTLDMEKGIAIMTVAFLFLLVTSGLLVRNIPFSLEWLRYTSPFRYSYNASVQLIFNRPVPCDGSGLLAACGGADNGFAAEQDVIGVLGAEFSAGFNAAMLLMMSIVIRIMAFFALKCKKVEERE